MPSLTLQMLKAYKSKTPMQLTLGAQNFRPTFEFSKYKLNYLTQLLTNHHMNPYHKNISLPKTVERLSP